MKVFIFVGTNFRGFVKMFMLVDSSFSGFPVFALQLLGKFTFRWAQGRSLPLISTEAGGLGGAAPQKLTTFLTNRGALSIKPARG